MNCSKRPATGVRTFTRERHFAAFWPGTGAKVHRRIAEMGRGAKDPAGRHHHPSAAAEEAPNGYDIFCKKQDNCVKVVLKP